jgi:hypothetical protein
VCQEQGIGIGDRKHIRSADTTRRWRRSALFTSSDCPESRFPDKSKVFAIMSVSSIANLTALTQSDEPVLQIVHTTATRPRAAGVSHWDKVDVSHWDSSTAWAKADVSHWDSSTAWAKADVSHWDKAAA